MKTEEANASRTVFNVLLALCLPLALLASSILYVQLAGTISQGWMGWFEGVERSFGEDFENSGLVFGLVGLVIVLYVLIYLFSYLIDWPRRPRRALLFLHAQAALLLGSLLCALAAATLSDLPGLVIVIPGLVPVFFWPWLMWRMESGFGARLKARTEKLADAGEFAASNLWLQVAIRFRPDDLVLQRQLGLTRFETGDVIGAIEMLEPLRGEDCDDIEMLDALLECYQTERRWEDALAIARLILRKEPGRISARVVAARLLDRLQNSDEALEILRAALPTNDLGVLEMLLEQILRTDAKEDAIEVGEMIEAADTGQRSTAIDCYVRIFQKFPRSPDAAEHLGRILIRQGKVDEGYACLEELISIDQQRWDIHRELVHYYQDRNDLEGAEPHLEALLDAGHDTMDVALMYGNLLIQRENYDMALMHFQHAVENYPDDDRFAYFLSQILVETGGLEEAQHWAEEALRRATEPDNEARARALRKRIEDALVEREMHVWQERCKRNPDDVELHLDLIEKMVRLGQADQAIAECDAVLEKQPKSLTSITNRLEPLLQEVEKTYRLKDYLADLYIRRKDYDAAFETALDMATKAVDGQALLVEHCERILRHVPFHERALMQLARITREREEWDRTLELHERLYEASAPERRRELLPVLFEAACKTGATRKAIETGEIMLGHRAQDVELHAQLARLHAEVRNHEEAQKHLEAAESIDFYHASLAGLKEDIEAKRRDQRVDDLLAHVSKNPGDADAQMELGDLYANRKAYKRAVSAYQAAGRDAKHQELARAKQAWTMVQLSMFDLAEETLEECHLTFDDPNDENEAKRLVYEIGMMWQEKDHPERALKMFKKIFRIDAGFRDIVERIDKLQNQV